MYSDSDAQAHGARVQSPKCEENFTFYKTCDKYTIQTFINLLLSTKGSTEVFLGVSAKIKAPLTFIHVSVVILLLLCKIK